MRYNFYYILSLLGKLPAGVKMKLRSYIKVDNLHYEFTSYETNLTAILCQRFPNTVETKLKQTQENITKHKRKYNNLLIINTGHWSLKYRTLLDHLIDMHKVAEAVETFRKL